MAKTVLKTLLVSCLEGILTGRFRFNRAVGIGGAEGLQPHQYFQNHSRLRGLQPHQCLKTSYSPDLMCQMNLETELKNPTLDQSSTITKKATIFVIRS